VQAAPRQKRAGAAFILSEVEIGAPGQYDDEPGDKHERSGEQPDAGECIENGRTWPAPVGATQVKTFAIYRCDPEAEGNPRIDMFAVDLDDYGPMVLDALIWIKNKLDSTLTFRWSCREGVCGSCAMNMGGTNWLACTRFISDTSRSATIFPLANLPIIKDLVPDTANLFSRYEMIEPWLHAETPTPEKERLQSPEERPQLDGYYECILCFCCTSGCPSHWWNADITYIPPRQGFLYLAAVREWATRRVLSWRLSNSMDAEFCIQALEEALTRYGAPEIFNTDQRSQFTSARFVDVLKDAGLCGSRWMAAAGGWTTSSSSGSGAASNTSASTSTPWSPDRSCGRA
jgi:succinate dehydrogenase / fumarate reductase iron-sulfur subunit